MDRVLGQYRELAALYCFVFLFIATRGSGIRSLGAGGAAAGARA